MINLKIALFVTLLRFEPGKLTLTLINQYIWYKKQL